jgi:adenylate kinase family enzyme
MAEFDPKIKTVLYLGHTGSGKGVQSKLLSEKTGFEVFSTGGRYRELRVGESDLAVRIREQYDKGLLMPPWFSTFLFEEAFLHRPLSEGLICEGIGRTVFEAQQFHEVMEWLRRPYVVFCLSISEEESVRRQMLRAKAEHRPESDSEEKLRVRFAEYDKHTGPAIELLRSKGNVVDLNGERTVEIIHDEVLDILKNLS